jgi:hypothetical protein
LRYSTPTSWISLNRHYFKNQPRRGELVARELQRSNWMPKAEVEFWTAMVVDTVVPTVDKVSDISDRLSQMLEFSLEDPSDIQDTLSDSRSFEMLRQFPERTGFQEIRSHTPEFP